MRSFRRVNSSDADVNLGKQSATLAHGYTLKRTHRVVLQVCLLLGYFPSWKPTPSSESSTWRVEEVEVICIADSGHCSKQAPLPKESRPDVRSLGNAPQVRTVESNRDEYCSCEKECGDYRPGVCIVRPICGVEIICP